MVAKWKLLRGTARGPDEKERNRSGFTIIEVVIAIIVLAFGLLGMAGTTALVVRQISLAEVTTERSVALQSTLERLQSLPFDSVVPGTDSVGVFGVRWSVTASLAEFKVLEVVTRGPGLKAASGGFPMLVNNVPDTFIYRVIRK